MSAAIDLEAVSVDRGANRVIHGITLHIDCGRWFGLIGANGSGKTSLLRAIGGRLPFAAGRCRLGNEDLTDDRAARAARIGFAPPAEALPEALRGREVLSLVARDLDRALDNLGTLREALEIDTLLCKWVGDCSAGMRQRITIAAAFAVGQPVVILDEPFNWLDPVAAFDVRQVLRAMVDNGLTLLTALHDLTTLTQSCDTGVMLTRGHIGIALEPADLRNAATDLPGFERRMIETLRASPDEADIVR